MYVEIDSSQSSSASTPRLEQTDHALLSRDTVTVTDYKATTLHNVRATLVLEDSEMCMDFLGVTYEKLMALSERCLVEGKPFTLLKVTPDHSYRILEFVRSLDGSSWENMCAGLREPPPDVLKLILPAINLGFSPALALIVISCSHRVEKEAGRGALTDVQELFYFYFRFGLSHENLDMIGRFGLPMTARGSRSRKDTEAGNSSMQGFVWIMLEAEPNVLTELVRDNYQGKCVYV